MRPEKGIRVDTALEPKTARARKMVLARQKKRLEKSGK
jgi:hypothetical protein